MKAYLKNNLPLVVGISLPILFVIILAIAVTVPSLLAHPQYNFLYTNADPYPYNTFYQNHYSITGTELTLDPVTPPTNLQNMAIEQAPPLFLYNVKTNSSQEITFAQAQQYSLDPGPTSPDGYDFSYKYATDDYFLLFGGGDTNSSGYYLSKGDVSKRLVIPGTTDYTSNMTLVGWIQQ